MQRRGRLAEQGGIVGPHSTLGSHQLPHCVLAEAHHPRLRFVEGLQHRVAQTIQPNAYECEWQVQSRLSEPWLPPHNAAAASVVSSTVHSNYMREQLQRIATNTGSRIFQGAHL